MVIQRDTKRLSINIFLECAYPAFLNTATLDIRMPNPDRLLRVDFDRIAAQNLAAHCLVDETQLEFMIEFSPGVNTAYAALPGNAARQFVLLNDEKVGTRTCVLMDEIIRIAQERMCDEAAWTFQAS